MKIPEIEQNIEKHPLPFYIIAFGLVAANSHFYERILVIRSPDFKEAS